MSDVTPPSPLKEGLAATVARNLGFGKPATEIKSDLPEHEVQQKERIDQAIALSQARVARGGAWGDVPEFETSDWAGERGGGQASTDEGKTHIPKTAQQIDEEITNKAGITPEVIGALARQIESKLLRQSGSTGTSLIAVMQQEFTSQMDRVEQWLKSQENRITSVIASGKGTASDDDKRVAQLSEAVALLAQKQQAIIASTVSNAKEQFEVLQVATEILKERRAVDESEVASEQSDLRKMQTHLRATAERIATLEPYLEPEPAKRELTVTSKQSARKRFGTRG